MVGPFCGYVPEESKNELYSVLAIDLNTALFSVVSNVADVTRDTSRQISNGHRRWQDHERDLAISHCRHSSSCRCRSRSRWRWCRHAYHARRTWLTRRHAVPQKSNNIYATLYFHSPSLSGGEGRVYSISKPLLPLLQLRHRNRDL